VTISFIALIIIDFHHLPKYLVTFIIASSEFDWTLITLAAYPFFAMFLGFWRLRPTLPARRLEPQQLGSLSP
jgi:hypothetical protein